MVLARTETRNAQDRQMLYEIDRAFGLAVRDDAVKVIIVAADGPHFSSGHDLYDCAPMSDFTPTSLAGGFELPGAEGWMATEQELYVGLCWRWRNLPKPTIAQVQGKVIAGGLMLVWPFDLVIASDDATFSDPVVAFGVNGHEYFVHTWELGARKAKEMLFTGAALGAEECRQLGMVNHVVAARRAREVHARARAADRHASEHGPQAREAGREPGSTRRDSGTRSSPPSRCSSSVTRTTSRCTRCWSIRRAPR